MEIALNKESKRKTPSVVAFRDGMRTFGEDAQTLGLRFPATSYGYLVDLLGKTIDNPIVALYKYVAHSPSHYIKTTSTNPLPPPFTDPGSLTTRSRESPPGIRSSLSTVTSVSLSRNSSPNS